LNLKKNQKIVTCQAVIVPCGSDRVTWQWPWHVSILCQVSFSYSQFGPFILICLNLVPIFVKISNFAPLQIEIKFNFI